jgi:hypothetical protein
MLYENFRTGLNLGGWLAQVDVNEPRPFTEEEVKMHYKNFTTEDSIRQIAGWGFDHVRLPINGTSLADDNPPYRLNGEVLSYIERCIGWCRDHKLNLILDLHDIKGNISGQMDKPIPLLVDQNLKDRFMGIWVALAEQFKQVHEPVIMFELFNEISDATGYLWRRLYRETIRRIRAVDPDRWILVGSNNMNSVQFLPELDLLDDELVFYTFHFYDPQVFTHQKAHFSPEHREYGQTVEYPGDISGFKIFLQSHPQYLSKHRLAAGEERNDFALMKKLLKGAKDFIDYSGRELYCGEYGVIDSAPVAEAAKWLRDFNNLADEYRFGRALWNYKERDFGLVDKQNQIRARELIEACK